VKHLAVVVLEDARRPDARDLFSKIVAAAGDPFALVPLGDDNCAGTGALHALLCARSGNATKAVTLLLQCVTTAATKATRGATTSASRFLRASCRRIASRMFTVASDGEGSQPKEASRGTASHHAGAAAASVRVRRLVNFWQSLASGYFLRRFRQ
jgi:hypothetical protein